MILDADITLLELLLKIMLPLIIAGVVGAFVGIERQNVGKAAGLSSHVLVAVASTGIAIMQRLMFEYQLDLAALGVAIDPEGQRVIAQVVTGIGFIGAGVIIKDQTNVVKGITTAATIWVSAALGSLAGLGFYWETLICTVAVLIVNTTFKTDKFFKKWENREEEKEFKPKDDL